jgi:multidrug resistance efflux pump
VKAAQRAAGAAEEQVNVARAGVGLALANAGQVGIQQANLATTTRQTGESQADIAAAQAGREQVAARRSQIETARAQAEQARAALTNAQIALGDTYIYAPTDGTVVRKTANVGASLAPGSPILTLTVGDYVWVDANFKETQLRDVRPGQPAEIEVDAFPGIVFKGRVRSINEATGAATSLLPPENATGNFTKVVQRIPVRIEIEPASDNEDRKYARAADIRNLRQGMSVTATIDTAEKPDRSGANAANGSGEGVGIQQTPGSAGGGAGIGGSTSGTGLGAGGAAADGTPGADGTTGSPRQASGAVGQQGTAGQRMSRQGAAGQSTAQPGGPPTIPNPGAGPFGPDQNNPNSARSPGGINNGPALERPNLGTPSPPGRQGGFGTPGVVNPSGPAAGAGAPTGGAGASPSPSTPGPSGPSGPGAQGGAGTGGAGR